MSNPLLSGGQGERHLLLGNEAIVRGALEAGVKVVTCYPGTPSSEIPDTFYKMRAAGKYKIEYSINEKVALEVAAGAALGGVMSLVTMKHVGLNVAADPLFTAAYIGLPGGMVVVSADDPGCHSSQNEQDNRHYARAAGLPCFEPASAQEAKDMTRYAFRLARKLGQPVLLRTTTRLNHLRGGVVFDQLPEDDEPVEWKKEQGRYVPVPALAPGRHRALQKNLEAARELAENSEWLSVKGQGHIGVIASGISRAYLADALYSGSWGDKVKVLELGMTWPLPEKAVTDFLRSCDKVLVLEEGDPLLENDVRALAQRAQLSVEVTGKTDVLTIYGEYSTVSITRALAAVLDCPCPVMESRAGDAGLPNRPPSLCPGCAHRSVYYAVRQAFGDDAVYASDIGCYTLGLMPPLRMSDFLVCMGASVSAGSGFAMVSGKPVVGFIGDSTFFHSGMTGLANAVFNHHNLLLIILDNGTTAMTGHQPNPGMLQSVLGGEATHLDIEPVVRALGVTEVKKVHSYSLRQVTQALKEFRDKDGVRVIIAEDPCMLYARRVLKKTMPQVAYIAQQSEAVERCLTNYACPAFYRDGDNVAIDETLCAGCMVCLQVAPKDIKARKR